MLTLVCGLLFAAVSAVGLSLALPVIMFVHVVDSLTSTTPKPLVCGTFPSKKKALSGGKCAFSIIRSDYYSYFPSIWLFSCGLRDGDKKGGHIVHIVPLSSTLKRLLIGCRRVVASNLEFTPFAAVLIC